MFNDLFQVSHLYENHLVKVKIREKKDHLGENLPMKQKMIEVKKIFSFMGNHQSFEKTMKHNYSVVRRFTRASWLYAYRDYEA